MVWEKSRLWIHGETRVHGLVAMLVLVLLALVEVVRCAGWG